MVNFIPNVISYSNICSPVSNMGNNSGIRFSNLTPINRIRNHQPTFSDFVQKINADKSN